MLDHVGTWHHHEECCNAAIPSSSPCSPGGSTALEDPLPSRVDSVLLGEAIEGADLWHPIQWDAHRDLQLRCWHVPGQGAVFLSVSELEIGRITRALSGGKLTSR